MVNIDGYRELGKTYFFEYHCTEDHGSSDAEIWYRSHQLVTVLCCVNAEDYGHLTEDERYENGEPLVYSVRFMDGLEWDVFEDELMESEEDYYRHDPPSKPSPEVIAESRIRFGYKNWPVEMIRLP